MDISSDIVTLKDVTKRLEKTAKEYEQHLQSKLDRITDLLNNPFVQHSAERKELIKVHKSKILASMSHVIQLNTMVKALEINIGLIEMAESSIKAWSEIIVSSQAEMTQMGMPGR